MPALGHGALTSEVPWAGAWLFLNEYRQKTSVQASVAGTDMTSSEGRAEPGREACGRDAEPRGAWYKSRGSADPRGHMPPTCARQVPASGTPGCQAPQAELL